MRHGILSLVEYKQAMHVPGLLPEDERAVRNAYNLIIFYSKPETKTGILAGSGKNQSKPLSLAYNINLRYDS
jgi:hypothetical protein